MAKHDMGVKIRFHKGAWWLFINHRNQRRAKKIGDRQTALRTAQQVREAMIAGDLALTPKPPPETVQAYARAWLRGLERNLKASTVRFYRENLDRHVLPLLGDRPLASVTRADGRELIAACRQKGLRLNTVKGIARTLSTLLSQAVEDDKLLAHPCLRLGRYLRRGDEPKTVVQPLTREEAAHLVNTAAETYPRWHPWVLCALRTGMRAGELLALQWRDIDWHGGFILVQRNQVQGLITSPKSHQRRRVDMSSQLASTLLAWRRLQRERYLEKGLAVPDWVFASADGQVLEERNVRTVFARLLEKAGLRHIRIHDLRHTFASLLLQQGESVVYVKEQLGHASIQITVDTYGHLIPGANRAAVDGLDDAPTHPAATQAQPQPQDAVAAEPESSLLENAPAAASEGRRPERAARWGMLKGPHRAKVERSEPRWNRTINPQIKSLLLCQLS
jgi:integrase